MTDNSDKKKTSKSKSKQTDDTQNPKNFKPRSGMDRRVDNKTADEYPAEKDRRKGPRRYDERKIAEISKNFTEEMSENRKQIKQAERQAVIKAVATSVMFFIIIVGSTLIFLGPSFFAKKENVKIKKIEALEERQTYLQEKQDELFEMQKNFRKQISEFAGGDMLSKISKIDSLSQELQMMNSRIGMLQSSSTGQKILNDGTKDLQKMLLGMQGRVDNLEGALEDAKKENDALGDILEGMNGNDLKAAAMMLAVTQLRETLMRGGSPDQDLQTVRMLAGDDEELLAAIDKIEPYAKNGVMSREKLTGEFKALAGEIAQAELRGEDVSWKDKALNRLNNLVTVKKQGMVDGEDRASITARAESMMKNGDIKGAIAELEKLDPAAKQKAQPWINEAQARVAAEELSSVLSTNFVDQLKSMTRGGLGNGLGRSLNMGTSGGSSLPSRRGGTGAVNFGGGSDSGF